MKLIRTESADHARLFGSIDDAVAYLREVKARAAAEGLVVELSIDVDHVFFEFLREEV